MHVYVGFYETKCIFDLITLHKNGQNKVPKEYLEGQASKSTPFFCHKNLYRLTAVIFFDNFTRKFPLLALKFLNLFVSFWVHDLM